MEKQSKETNLHNYHVKSSKYSQEIYLHKIKDDSKRDELFRISLNVVFFYMLRKLVRWGGKSTKGRVGGKAK